MHLLVCGGAGYVGSHAALTLAQRGHNARMLDGAACIRCERRHHRQSSWLDMRRF